MPPSLTRDSLTSAGVSLYTEAKRVKARTGGERASVRIASAPPRARIREKGSESQPKKPAAQFS